VKHIKSLRLRCSEHSERVNNKVFQTVSARWEGIRKKEDHGKDGLMRLRRSEGNGKNRLAYSGHRP